MLVALAGGVATGSAVARGGLVQSGPEAHVGDFGAIGDGRIDDTAAIRRAVIHALATPGVTLRFDDATYRVGAAAATAESLFVLRGSNGFTMRGRPRFRLDRTNHRQVTVFDIQMSDVDIEHVETIGDPWTVPLATALNRGTIACLVRSPSGAPLANHRFGTIRVTNGLHALLYDANDRRWGRASGVSVGLIDVVDSIYAFNGANAPDRHAIGRIVADNVFRGYFVYGVDGGKADILVKPRYTGIFAGGTCANIAVYTESRPGASRNRVGDTRNIDVTIRNLSSRPSLQLSTNSMAPSDAAQGHYNIRAAVTSSEGSTLKVSNVDVRTGIQDVTTPYASPKRDVVVAAHPQRPSGCLDATAYGRWSDGRGLRIDCSTAIDTAPAIRQSYLHSGWQIGGAGPGR